MNNVSIGSVTPTDIPGTIAFPPRLSKAAIGSVLLASFTATWNGIHLGGLQLADIFLLLAFFATMAMVVFGNLRFPIPGWLWVPVAALLACTTALAYRPIPAASFAMRYAYVAKHAGVSDLNAPGGGLKSAFWIFALLVVPITVIACTTLESRAPKWILACFLAGVAVSSVVAVTDLTSLTHISRSLGLQFTDPGPNGALTSQRQTGLSDHPNTLGFVCTIAAPFALYFISESRRRWLGCVALVLVFGGVVASGSRGAQMVFLPAVLVAIFVSPHKKKVAGWLAATLGAAIIGGLTVLSQLAPGMLGKLFRFEPGATLPGASTSLDSDAERAHLRAQALLDFRNHPIFGIGIKHVTEAHNIYLQMMAAGGVVLVAGMLIYWFGTFRSCWLVKRHGEALGTYLMISVTGWLLIGALENELTDRFLYYTVACAVALAATCGVQTQASALPDRDAGGARLLPGSVVIAD
jgi:hypothetical protein